MIVKKKIVHQAPAPSSDGKKKPHANQWTYMRKDDPNRPKGANQYTVKRRLEALAAAAKAEAAAGGSGAAAAAYQAELYKTTNKGAYVRAAVEAAQREFSEEFGSSPTSTPVAKPKVYKASHKGKERDAGSGALTAERLARQQAGEGGGEVATKKKKKKKEEDAKSTVSEDDRIYCICRQLYDPERMMIACDRCAVFPVELRGSFLKRGGTDATIGITTTVLASTKTTSTWSTNSSARLARSVRGVALKGICRY